MTNRVRKAILLIGDLVLFYVALAIVVFARYGANIASIQLHAFPFTFVFAIWIPIYYAFSLYLLKPLREYRQLPYAIALGLLVAVALFYTVPAFEIAPKTNLLLTAALAGALTYGWRAVYSRGLRHSAGAERVLLLGSTTEIPANLFATSGTPETDFVARQVLVSQGVEPVLNENVAIRTAVELREHTRHDRPDTVVLAERLGPDYTPVIYELLLKGTTIATLPSFVEQKLGLVPVYDADDNWIVEHLQDVHRTYFDNVKRLLDLVLAIVLVIPFLALIPFVALAIKVTSRGPVFFSQTRVGERGKPYRVIKFRSMRIDAEANGAQWASKNDPRITPIGGFLRASRIDELPQLLNVLRGEMSFIGPRPERPEFVQDLAKRIPHYSLRSLVKPGISGWAQVNYPYGSSEEDAARKLEYDLFYIKNRSLMLDLRIFLRTIGVVILRKGQ